MSGTCFARISILWLAGAGRSVAQIVEQALPVTCLAELRGLPGQLVAADPAIVERDLLLECGAAANRILLAQDHYSSVQTSKLSEDIVVSAILCLQSLSYVLY